MIVLMINDFPIGVYTNEVKAGSAAQSDWACRESNCDGLKLGESRVDGCDGYVFMKWHYRQYEFTVNAKARL